MPLPPLPFDARPVRRIHRPDPETFWSLAHDEPIILTGCMEDWALLKELQERASYEQKLALLGSLFGEQLVGFETLPRQLQGHYHFRTDLEGFTFIQSEDDVPFSEFGGRLLKSLHGASDEYVYLQANLLQPETPLYGKLGPGVLPYLSEDQRRPLIWIGSDGQIVNLHYDDFLNFICMLEGTKRVTLFAPELMPFMYHAPPDQMLKMAQASHVRLLEWNRARFPLFEQALREARVAVVEPGEVLYIPPMWWHHVESFGFNVMINNWVLGAPFERLFEMGENVTRGIRLFFEATAEQRAQALQLYQRTVFAPETEATSGLGPESGETPEQLEHRELTRQFVMRVPDFLRRQLAHYYGHFVFQASGDPVPSQPGAFAAMVERNAASTNYFSRG